MSDPTPRLEIRNLRRAYGGRQVVDDVSLQIMPGQVTCLLGPSGCGKSTTLRMIAGVEMQDSGTIHVDGKLICDTMFRVPPERREIGLMFQDFALFPHLSVADNVGFGLKKGTKAEKRKRIEELLERVDLLRYIDGYPHQLSGGLRQRVMIALALMCEPDLLIADEPTTALDVTIQAQILRLLVDLTREMNMAMILITHDLGVVARVADKVAVMYAGELVETGPSTEVFARPSHPYTRGLLRCIPQPGKTERGAPLGTIPGIVPSLIGEVTGCAFRTRCPHARPECRAPIPQRGDASHAFRCIHPDGALSQEGEVA